jgi:hypothetical protein
MVGLAPAKRPANSALATIARQSWSLTYSVTSDPSSLTFNGATMAPIRAQAKMVSTMACSFQNIVATMSPSPMPAPIIPRANWVIRAFSSP